MWRSESCRAVRERLLGVLIILVFNVLALLIVPVHYEYSVPGGSRWVFLWDVLFPPIIH